MHRLGITIFDITSPSHVSYCYVDFYGMESNHPVQLMTPLSAKTYVEAYMDLDKPKDDQTTELLENFRRT